MKPITREWIKKAENDFKVLSLLVRRRKHRVPDAVCFFSQQCVEKYLKARMTEAGLGFPKTHDLYLLLNLVGSLEPTRTSFGRAVKALTNYAVDYRYPGNFATWHEAKAAYQYCRNIRIIVRRSLGLRK